METAIGSSQWSLFASFAGKKYDSLPLLPKCLSRTAIFSSNPILRLERKLNEKKKKKGLNVVTPDLSSPIAWPEILEAWNDDYNGVVVNPESLPTSSNAFASALKASLSNWTSKGKKGVWLKIRQDQAELVPVAIQEGFNYHHADPGYVMLTYWIPDDLCLLPSTPSHQIGVASFVINHKKEVLVVKEKCPCTCSHVWKLPTGYIDKCEDILCGAVREVKEETGIDTLFLQIVAFRHAHLMAFEHSDLQFVCMLKPLSFDITIDDNEIQAAKWMGVDEFIRQPFYEDDPTSKKMIEICVAAEERSYSGGYIGHQMTSKLDNKLSYLYHAP